MPHNHKEGAGVRMGGSFAKLVGLKLWSPARYNSEGFLDCPATLSFLFLQKLCQVVFMQAPCADPLHGFHLFASFAAALISFSWAKSTMTHLIWVFVISFCWAKSTMTHLIWVFACTMHHGLPNANEPHTLIILQVFLTC